LVTARLELRPYTLDDLPEFAALRGDPEVQRFVYQEPAEVDEARRILAEKAASTAIAKEGDGLSLAIIPRGESRTVGYVTLIWRSAEHRRAEVGFMVHPDHQGRGYATEAAGAMLALAFGELGAHRVIGRLDERNTPSARVCERLGMRREAHMVENELIRGEWTSELLYAILDREWQADPRRS
jgi:RimJ/RimL family protein N-acetyltransferase